MWGRLLIVYCRLTAPPTQPVTWGLCVRKRSDQTCSLKWTEKWSFCPREEQIRKTIGSSTASWQFCDWPHTSTQLMNGNTSLTYSKVRLSEFWHVVRSGILHIDQNITNSNAIQWSFLDLKNITLEDIRSNVFPWIQHDKISKWCGIYICTHNKYIK